MSATLHHVEIKGVLVPLILEKSKQLPVATMEITFKNAGALTDPVSGTAKVAMDLLNQGTKSLGVTKFSQKLEEKAIHLMAHSGLETCVIEISSLKEQFKAGVKYCKKLLEDPNYTSSAFDKVKTKIEGKILQKEADFDYLASLNLLKTLYKNTPLSQPSIGTLQSLHSINLQSVKEFITNRFVLKKAILSFGGDLSLEEAKEYAISLLSSLEVGEEGGIDFFQPIKNPNSSVIQKETQQSYIYFGSPFYLKDLKEEYIGRVAGFILGSSGFGSRLMEEIRVKRGLAYSAYGKFTLNKTHTYFSGYLQTKLESQEEAKKVVQEVVDDFLHNGATKEELEEAKKFLLGSEPLRVETATQRLQRSLNEVYKGHDLGWSKKQLNKIQDLSLEQLNQFIAGHKEIRDLSFSVVTR